MFCLQNVYHLSINCLFPKVYNCGKVYIEKFYIDERDTFGRFLREAAFFMLQNPKRNLKYIEEAEMCHSLGGMVDFSSFGQSAEVQPLPELRGGAFIGSRAEALPSLLSLRQ